MEYLPFSNMAGAGTARTGGNRALSPLMKTHSADDRRWSSLNAACKTLLISGAFVR
jgi:hypothetical protein